MPLGKADHGLGLPLKFWRICGLGGDPNSGLSGLRLGPSQKSLIREDTEPSLYLTAPICSFESKDDFHYDLISFLSLRVGQGLCC